MLCALVLCLPGCSMVRLGYGQAPDLAYWWFDRYVDFNDLQTPRVRNTLAQWFDWNRRTQLADYAALLARAQSDVLADTTPERACEYATAVRRRIDTAVDRAVPAVADIMLTFTPQQLQNLERHYAKTNAEFRADYLQADPADRNEAAVKRTVERIEMLYSRLDEAQLAQIDRAVRQSPFDPELWLAERLQRQREVLAMLRRLQAERAGPEQAQAALRAHIRGYERSPREVYRVYVERLTEFNCGFGANLHNGMSAAQRQAAAQRLKGWETDLRALVAEAR